MFFNSFFIVLTLKHNTENNANNSNEMESTKIGGKGSPISVYDCDKPTPKTKTKIEIIKVPISTNGNLSFRRVSMRSLPIKATTPDP